MADISSITLPGGGTYDLKDKTAVHTNASGILKGDGAGGVSAAAAGTDYQAPLTIDATPTANSTNPVQSGGVYTDVRTRVPNYGKGVNLLRNWYFKNPVNQRGNTSGTTANNAYFLDGWKTTYGTTSGTWALTSSGLLVTPAASTYAVIMQNVDDALLNGFALTASILLSDGTIDTATLASRTSGTSQYFGSGVSWQIDGNGVFRHRVYSMKTIVAIKLELGSEQTLAHQENGTWVLNEIPNYEAELIKCQTSTADSTDTYANKSLANEQELAYVESGTTASRDYAIGEYFCWNGLLHRVISPISSGGTFTPGTNCEQATGGGLNDIGISISTISGVSGNTTIQIGGYFKIGYVVIFSVAIQASKNLVSGDTVCQGLPSVRANNIALRFYNNNSQTFGDAILVNTGVITLKSSVSNGQSIRLTGAYIA